jgi:hypothetical protein
MGAISLPGRSPFQIRLAISQDLTVSPRPREFAIRPSAPLWYSPWRVISAPRRQRERTLPPNFMRRMRRAPQTSRAPSPGDSSAFMWASTAHLPKNRPNRRPCEGCEDGSRYDTPATPVAILFKWRNELHLGFFLNVDQFSQISLLNLGQSGWLIIDLGFLNVDHSEWDATALLSSGISWSNNGAVIMFACLVERSKMHQQESDKTPDENMTQYWWWEFAIFVREIALGSSVIHTRDQVGLSRIRFRVPEGFAAKIIKEPESLQ